MKPFSDVAALVGCDGSASLVFRSVCNWENLRKSTTSSAVIPGVQITVTDAATQASRVASTDKG